MFKTIGGAVSIEDHNTYILPCSLFTMESIRNHKPTAEQPTEYIDLVQFVKGEDDQIKVEAWQVAALSSYINSPHDQLNDNTRRVQAAYMRAVAGGAVAGGL